MPRLPGSVGAIHQHNNQVAGQQTKKAKFPYTRPDFLLLRTSDEIDVTADHLLRPIIVPRDVARLPWNSGYAECINAGKSVRNEDQAACYQDVAVRQSIIGEPTASQLYKKARVTLPSRTQSTLATSSCSNNSIVDSCRGASIEDQIPWTYFGIFDGHAGSAVAVAAAAQLHHIIGEKLNQAAGLLIALEFELDKYTNSHDDDEFDLDLSANNNLQMNRGDHSTSNVRQQQRQQQPQSSDAKQPTQQADSTKLTKSKTTSSLSSLAAAAAAVISSASDNKRIERDDDDETMECNTQQEAASLRIQETHIIRDTIRLPSLLELCQNNVTVDSLVTGILESAFWQMDALIGEDKQTYAMAGGCTAIVSVFILGKLYVCNAGDSRAVVHKSGQAIPMSYDFTPTSERERILRLGLQRPDFLGNDFTHLEFLKRPTRKDLGKQMLYKDAYMSGWSLKTITYDDLKFPLVWGKGKRSRVLATIGVTRGFGDHELRAQYGQVPIKPFLTPEPEVRVLALEHDETLTNDDVLMMGSDGLWDVTSNEQACAVVQHSPETFPFNDLKYRYMSAAHDLVRHSRGELAQSSNSFWRSESGDFASLDDVAAFVIPLKRYRDEYVEWKRLRMEHQKQQESNGIILEDTTNYAPPTNGHHHGEQSSSDLPAVLLADTTDTNGGS